ncbi:MAG: hypothetical protein ACOX3K_01910 [Bacilli bacterium]|jgi:ABC-type glycerol-3-phosphate transport system substrate-binding protein
MKTGKRLLLIFVAVAFSTALLGSCDKNPFIIDEDGLRYDEYPTDYDPDIDSWEQIDPDDEDVEITWWVDNPDWSFYHIDRLIEKRTGVKVKFESALRTDGTELATMIAGKMKDVITITDYATRTQLAKDGYVYALDRLAESYAPSFLKRVSPEQKAHYTASDGHFYGVANNFYNDADIASYEEMGNKILPNYAIVVRKDMLKAYLAHKRSENPNFNENVETTTAEGFIEMALWVKQNYHLPDSNPTVCMSEFPTKAMNGSLSTGISTLMEYFNVPREDADGNLVYQYETDEFKEVLAFMNQLFNKKLLISGNFSYSRADIISHIKNGRPFAIIGGIQNYSTGFSAFSAGGYNPETKTFADEREYVPIVITNSKKEAPVLWSLAGRGLRVSMITKDAKRVDRIIKVFDYMMSEQGQREVYYGENEGVYYNFIKRPGETETINVHGKSVDYTYPYGKIEWTRAAKDLLGAADGSGWYHAGIKAISVLANPMYVMLTSVYGAEMDTYQFYTRYNQKCALLPYTHSALGFKFALDYSDPKKYNEMINIQTKIEEAWIKSIPQLTMRANIESMLNDYGTTLRKTIALGSQRLLEFQNASFLANKQKMNLAFAYALNDSEYVAPEVMLEGNYALYRKEVPDYIAIRE